MLRKCCLMVLGVWITLPTAGFAAPALKALIVDGRMNQWHDSQATSPLLKKQLEETGLFSVDFATSPPQGEDLTDFYSGGGDLRAWLGSHLGSVES